MTNAKESSTEIVLPWKQGTAVEKQTNARLLLVKRPHPLCDQPVPHVLHYLPWAESDDDAIDAILAQILAA